MTDICKIGLLHPAGARTNFLRTLSKINGLKKPLHPDPEDVSSKGAAHYTALSKNVNTPNRRVDPSKPHPENLSGGRGANHRRSPIAPEVLTAGLNRR